MFSLRKQTLPNVCDNGRWNHRGTTVGNFWVLTGQKCLLSQTLPLPRRRRPYPQTGSSRSGKALRGKWTSWPLRSFFPHFFLSKNPPSGKRINKSTKEKVKIQYLQNSMRKGTCMGCTSNLFYKDNLFHKSLGQHIFNPRTSPPLPPPLNNVDCRGMVVPRQWVTIHNIV